MCLRLIRIFSFFSFFRPLFSNFYHQGVGGSSALQDITIASFLPILPSHFGTMREVTGGFSNLMTTMR